MLTPKSTTGYRNGDFHPSLLVAYPSLAVFSGLAGQDTRLAYMYVPNQGLPTTPFNIAYFLQWIVPTLSGLMTGFGLLSIFLQALNYIVDAYLML